MCILSWLICKLVCHRGCEPCAHAVIHLWVYSKVTYFQWFCQVLELKQIVIVTFLDLLNPSDHAALVLKHFFTRWNWKNHTKKYKKKRPPYCVRTLTLLAPQGRPGAAGGLRKYFSSAPPNFWWVNYIKKVCLAGESTYPKVL